MEGLELGCPWRKVTKQFASRISKKQRKSIDLTNLIGEEVFKRSDKKLLEGVLLDEVNLFDILLKEQVRTKFNDNSIRELAKNIETNGLIQPLVVHRVGAKYTLICGERRYRAMSLIKMEKAPCYILENKSDEELMAIQFSENSSRESLHYIDKANGILNYQKATKASERKIQADLGISKSEVHRGLLMARMSEPLKQAAKSYDIEKYVLLEFHVLEASELKSKIERQILIGEMTKRVELKKMIRQGGVSIVQEKTKKRKRPTSKKTSLTAFIKAVNAQSQRTGLDKETKKVLSGLLQETKNTIDH